MEYGYTSIGTELLSNYLGSSASYSTQLINHNNLQVLSSINVQQHDADILYLKQKVCIYILIDYCWQNSLLDNFIVF